MSESDPSVREAIEAALDGGSSTGAGAAPLGSDAAAPTPPAPAAAPAAPTTESAPPATPTGQDVPRHPPGPAVAGPKAERSPFAPVQKFAEPAAKVPPPGNGAAPPAAELKAPASWKADLREKWKTLPTEVQSEVIRRERENDSRMQEHARVKQFADRFHQIAAPYRAFMDAEGANPLDAFHDYLRTATMLRTGAPDDKARLVAQLVHQFQIPLQALDAYLASAISGGVLPQRPQQQGPMPQRVQAQPQQFRDPRLDQLLAQIAERDGEALRTDIETFATDGKHEFFEDVRETMADVMDAAAKRGIKMNLDDAYARACQIEPAVKKVLDARAAQGSVGAAARTLAQARHAASSLPSQPAPPAPRNANAAPGTVREAILSAIDQLQNQA